MISKNQSVACLLFTAVSEKMNQRAPSFRNAEILGGGFREDDQIRLSPVTELTIVGGLGMLIIVAPNVAAFMKRKVSEKEKSTALPLHLYA